MISVTQQSPQTQPLKGLLTELEIIQQRALQDRNDENAPDWQKINGALSLITHLAETAVNLAIVLDKQNRALSLKVAALQDKIGYEAGDGWLEEAFETQQEEAGSCTTTL